MSKVKKIALRVGGAAIILFALFYFVVGPIMMSATKKASPEQTISFTQGDLQTEVFYCSPAVKGRKIFGDLVPFNEVWRTGANEATTFTTNKALTIQGQELPAGTYTLWTIPGPDKWQIMFNSKMYGWGVKFTNQKPARDPDHDTLVAEAIVSSSFTKTENFTISFTEDTASSFVMMLAWDDVVVPLKMEH